jgi:hypothetical protein
VFKAYLDETGIQRHDPYCIIAGYVGEVCEWKKVGWDWKFVLDAFKVPYFHALEFYGDDEKKLYRGWKPGKRAAFLNALFDCLRDHKVWLISSAVDVRAFWSFTEDERRYVTGGVHNGMKWKSSGAPTKPYFLPFHEAVIQSCSHTPEDDKVWTIMSRQEQYRMKALELYDMMLASEPAMQCRPKLGDDMVFSDPKAVYELQAADLAAYWSGKAMRYIAKAGTRSLARFPNRVEMARLFERMRDWSDLKLFNFEGLMLLLQGSNRYIKTSFPTLDQTLPSVPLARRREILSDMRRVNFRKFSDQWQPSPQGDHG